ncbi:MAG TPA: hypothetical protein VHR66_06495 [Gemmataceae bacterium]|jgi:hypothetical protein|nr:hypothetical protein [Gemmataceae bacterium]
MSTITVIPDSAAASACMYRARAGDREAIGPTVGDAVNGVTDQVNGPQETTLIIVQPMKPDRFFNAEQIRRLKDLMAKWRAALNGGNTLPPEEQAELDDLVRAELDGMIERTKALGEPTKP